MSEQNVNETVEAAAELAEENLETVAGGGIVGDIIDGVEKIYAGIKEGIMCDQ